VYHDAGNINFSFILRKDTDFIDFREHIEPIRKVLNDLEIPCYITDRNDLFIDSKKISGNAEHVSNSSGRLIHHGTLLFNAQLNQLRQSLHTENPLIETHAVKSVRSSVANISEFRGDLSIQEFRKELIMRISRELAIGEIVDFYAEQNPDIIALSDGKYSHWDWIFGKSPQFTFQSNIGTITVRDGHIKAVDLPVEYSYLKASLSGLRYHRQHMLDKGIDKTIVNLICLPS
jgi:lipoate-protein ligase A